MTSLIEHDTHASSAVVPFTPAQVAFPDALTSRDVDRRLLARRTARTASGIMLMTGAVFLAFSAATGFHTAHAMQILLGTWAVAVLAYPLVLAAAHLGYATGNDPGRAGDRGLFASYAWPLAGLALILPLTLHGVFYGAAASAHDFDNWVQMSCAIVGHCHIALALMGVRRMRRLVNGEKAMPAAGIYGVVVGTAMVPGAVLVLIPPALVALTGLPFLFLFWLPERLIAKERAALATPGAI